MLNIEIDRSFFNLHVVTNDFTKNPMAGEYIEIYDKKLKGEYDSISKSVYKNKYNTFTDFNDSIKVYNRKFKEPVHRLTIAGNKLKEIKSLPKGLLSLWLQGIPKGYKLKLSTIPKTIVSIYYKWTEYTLGDDLTSLKNLKILGLPRNHMIFSVPKFPKSIEYVDISECQINRFDDNGLDNFKLSDYPNLKYINFSGNWIKKIPSEWKSCKTVKVLYGKQKV